MTSTLGDIVMPGEMPAGFKAGLESTKVMYRQLGKSGLRVSVPILGGMSFGHKKWLEWVKEEEEVGNPFECALNNDIMILIMSDYVGIADIEGGV